VVSMARPTRSFALYCQQFGRALRPMEGKPYAIIIDHVNNVLGLGLPDAQRHWSLGREENGHRGVPGDTVPLQVCINALCLAVFARGIRACPYCGSVRAPSSRSSPAAVDGDLLELAPDVLARLRGEIARIDGAPRVPQHLDQAAQLAVAKRHKGRQAAQNVLRKTIAEWAGRHKAQGREDAEIYRVFYFTFGTDIMTAQTLNEKQASGLNDKILKSIDNFRNKK
jgi:DNA repair protein RadD